MTGENMPSAPLADTPSKGAVLPKETPTRSSHAGRHCA